MQPISIAVADRVDDILARLDAEFRYLHEEGIHISIGQSSRGKFTFLDCKVGADRGEAGGGPDEGELSALVRHTVANALSDVIVGQWEADLINKIIRDSYYYFTREEQETIRHYADGNLAALAEPEERPLHYKVGRKSRILHQIRDYLDSASELNVEGFVTFRLKDYLEELEDAVDRAVDDFLMEREQKEFVRLLKYFVDVQEPRVDAVQVLLKPGGSFKLLDEAGGAIRSEHLEEFVVEMVESEINYEDLLISALITLAPRRVTIHGHLGYDRDESVETIRGVFGERVELCPGCSQCAGLHHDRRPVAKALSDPPLS